MRRGWLFFFFFSFLPMTLGENYVGTLVGSSKPGTFVKSRDAGGRVVPGITGELIHACETVWTPTVFCPVRTWDL